MARGDLPTPAIYYDLLKPVCTRIDIWHTIYNHVMAAPQAIVPPLWTCVYFLEWTPLADLGLFLFYWREPGDHRPAMTPAPSMLPGFPPRSYLAERYAKRTGADLSDLTSWVALAHFKSAVVAQGIAARVQAGSMAGQEFGDIGAEVDRIAAEGLALLTEGS